MALICTNCSRTAAERPIEAFDIALSPDLGLCDLCRDKFNRRSVFSGIQAESDRHLLHNKDAFNQYRPKEMCQCGRAALVYGPLGRLPMWCTACEAERQGIVERAKMEGRAS